MELYGCDENNERFEFTEERSSPDWRKGVKMLLQFGVKGLKAKFELGTLAGISSLPNSFGEAKMLELSFLFGVKSSSLSSGRYILCLLKGCSLSPLSLFFSIC